MSGRAGRFVGKEPSLVLFKDPHCGYIGAMMACQTDLDQVLRLLRQEREANPMFDAVWRMARDHHRSSSHQGGTGQVPEECYIAVRAYTLQTDLFQDFNNRCRELCGPGSWHNFRYKSLYCLLSRAAKGIHSNPPKQSRLYRGMDLHFAPNSLNGLVCFNQFSSSSINRHSAMQFTHGNGTLVEFPHGARAAMGITNLSAFPMEQEVLIFPWSTFKITGYERTGPVHRIVLESAGPRMDFTTCAYSGTHDVNPYQNSGPTCPPTYRPTCPPSHRPTCPPAHRPICPPAHRPTCPPAHRQTCPPAHRPTCPPAHRPICPPAHRPICPPGYRPICPTTFGPPSFPPRHPHRGGARPRGGFNFHLQLGKP